MKMKRIQPILKIDETNTSPPPKKQSFIPIIKPIDETITFDNVDDFTKYYQEHKEELEQLSTCKLNKMFKIVVDDEPLRITKIKGEMTLRTIPKSRITAIMRIEELEQQQNEIIEKINNIINFLTQSSMDST